MTVAAKDTLNMWWVQKTVNMHVLVGDKYNNPVQEGTAVYFTTSGGVVSTQAFTDDEGWARVKLFSGNPQPTIQRFYDVRDPNLGTVIPGPIPDFELGRVVNSQGNTGENDGVFPSVESGT